MSDYAQCPGCGRHPRTLHIECLDRAKWGRVMCGDCGGWEVEFRNGYAFSGSDEQMRAAQDEWNQAPRFWLA